MTLNAGDTQATINYVTGLQRGGGFLPDASQDVPTGPATLAAVRVFEYLKADVPNLQQCQSFVLDLYDPATGGIAYNAGTKPDVYSTSVGTLALVDLNLAYIETCRQILQYLYANAQDFINVYFAAFAWEAISGVFPDMTLPDDTRLKWLITIGEAANYVGTEGDGTYGKGDEMVATTAEAVAANLRLGFTNFNVLASNLFLQSSQRDDGGFGTPEASDIATTYEVMRAFNLIKQKFSDSLPDRDWLKDPDAAIKYASSCGNSDGGYGPAPGQPSTANTTYFAAYTLHFLSAI